MEGGQSVLDWVKSQASGAPPNPAGSGGTVMDWVKGQVGALKPLPPDTSGFDIRPEEPGGEQGTTAYPRLSPIPLLKPQAEPKGVTAGETARQFAVRAGQAFRGVFHNIDTGVGALTGFTEPRFGNEDYTASYGSIAAHQGHPVEGLKPVEGFEERAGPVAKFVAEKGGPIAGGAAAYGLGGALTGGGGPALFAGGAMGAADAAGAMYDQVLQDTGDPDTARLAAKLATPGGALAGSLSSAALGRLPGINKITNGLAKDLLLNAGTLGLGSGAQAALNTVIRNKLGGEDLKAWDEITSATAQGAGTGLLLRGTGLAAEALGGLAKGHPRLPAGEFMGHTEEPVSETTLATPPEEKKKPPPAAPEGEAAGGGQGATPVFPGESVPQEAKPGAQETHGEFVKRASEAFPDISPERAQYRLAKQEGSPQTQDYAGKMPFADAVAEKRVENPEMGERDAILAVGQDTLAASKKAVAADKAYREEVQRGLEEARQRAPGAAEPAEEAQPAPAESARKGEESPGLPLFKKPNLESKKAGAVDLFGQRKPSPEEEVQPDKLGFYSPIEKALVEKMPNVADVEHVKNIAKQAQPREYEFSGLEDFLKGKERVTKADVRNYLRANNVNVEETIGGEPNRNVGRVESMSNGKHAVHYPGLGTELYDTRAEAEQALKDTQDRLTSAQTEPTKFAQYQTPGGSNYRELRLTMPGREPDMGRPTTVKLTDDGYEVYNERGDPYGMYYAASEGEALERAKRNGPTDFGYTAAKLEGRGPKPLFTGGHFPEPNVLAHVRFNDRTDAQGRKTLFLEEVQSDWAAKGERQGFQQPNVDRAALEKELNQVRETQTHSMNAAEYEDAVRREREIVQQLEDQKHGGAVPNMPFKTREQYAKLALRRMIRYAAEKGYDSISWTTGDMQAERYDLSKHVSTVDYYPDVGALHAYDKDGVRVIHKDGIKPEQLPDYIGKDATDKLLKSEPRRDPGDTSDYHRLSGEQLKVGGEGMRAFYDKTLPKVANEIGKKWGAKAEKTEVGGKPGLWGVFDEDGYVQAHFPTKGEAESFRDEHHPEGTVKQSRLPGTQEVHTLRIPPEMRESVMTKGQPRLGRLDLFGGRGGKKPPESAAGEEGRFDVPDETKRDKAYSAIVNDFQRIVNLEKAAPNKVGGMSLEHALSAFPGRRFGEAEKLQKQGVDPLKQHLAANGIPAIESTPSKVSASDYLYALHAQDMAARGGVETGMKPADAQAILSKATGPEYEKIRDWNRALNEKRLDTLEGSGLISAEQRAAWEKKYGQDYVPLRTAKDPMAQLFGTSKGLGVSGKESKAREGRSSKADSPLAFAVETMQTALDRAESNKIGQKLGELITKNPEPSLWRIESDANKIKDGEERLSFKDNGEQRYIVTKDKGLADAFKRITKPDPGVLKILDPILNAWHKVIIQYNPIFSLKNVQRDVGETLIKHAIRGDLGAALQQLRGETPAIAGAFEAIRNEGAGGKWGDIYRDARDNGALIGWREQYSYEDRVKDFEKAFTKTGKIKAFLGLIDDMNRSVELGTRLSAYKAFLDRGMSKPEAAMESRRITADFARRGSLAPIYRRIYMFSGANVQGIAEAARSIKDNPGKASAVIGAMIGAGLLNYQFSKQFGDDHELDKLSEYDKARHFGIMIGKHKYGFTAPYTFSVFPYIGWKLGELLHGDTSKADALSNIAQQGIDAASPLPQGADVLQSLTPTIFRPAMELAQNKNFSGTPIYPEQDQFAKVPKPASKLFFRNVSGASKAVTEGLHTATGGTEVKPGAVEISPEVLDHLAAAMGGGVGTFGKGVWDTVRKMVTGQTDQIRATDIPGVRAFVVQPSRGAEGLLFKKNVGEVEMAKAQKKAHEEPDKPEALRLAGSASDAEKQIRALYKKMDLEGMSEKDKNEIQERIDEIRERFSRRAKLVLRGE